MPSLTLRPRGFCVLQSLKPQNLGSLWLASSLCVLSILRTLRSSVPRSPALELTRTVFLSCTSTPPRRLDLLRAVSLLASYVDRKPRSENTSRKLSDPTAFAVSRTPVCHSSDRRSGKKAFALLSSRTHLRVWLPSHGLLALKTLEASFSPQRSWVSPFRAFLLPSDREKAFPFLSPLLRFLSKPFRPCADASAA